MKYTILTLIWSLFVVNISAQQYSNKFEFKIGTGIVLIEKGTYNSSFENEIGYKLNKLLAASMAISTGRSFDSSVEHNDYLQGGLNIFISPWKNINRNNFKIGIG